mmetsp:Transcript_24790/g.44683  ORF Transcript_24790/g.44683 Transcript_24790/m.44683 type:complete len:80 (-) Transcript_24790:120-359(-)
MNHDHDEVCQAHGEMSRDGDAVILSHLPQARSLCLDHYHQDGYSDVHDDGAGVLLSLPKRDVKQRLLQLHCPYDVHAHG